MNRLSKLRTLGVFLALFIATSMMYGGFLTTDNISNLMRQSSFVGIMAIGMTFVILTGEIDLSVGAVAALCCVTTAPS
jgi:ribose transport system permease protein